MADSVGASSSMFMTRFLNLSSPDSNHNRLSPTDQRLLAAARDDNEEMILEVFEHEGGFDINYQDGCVISVV